MIARKKGNQLVGKLWEDILAIPESSKMSKLAISILQIAAKEGNVEFLTKLIRNYPDLIWKCDWKRHTIFHTAVAFRQEKIFSLIYHIGAIKDIIALNKDFRGNNILHLAANYKDVPQSQKNIVSGAALQMERELLWFREVEKIVPPSYLKMRNMNNLTPRELFTKTHESLRADGEAWMKGKAEYCMLTATLIATVVFAAAYTAPGGNSDDTGAPIHLKDAWFTVFMISDAVAMCTSTTSIILFLSILTSRYAEDDFRGSLPAKLMFGLLALFASIICMILAFIATFFVVYKSEMVWMPRLLAGFACIPVTLFAVLHSKLWVDTIRSTYWSRFLFQPKKYKIYE